MGIERFLHAQENTYSVALQEVKSGKKQSHWIWYIFPQLKGLGYSNKSQYYGIKDAKEAEEYWEHPVLRKRLLDITDALIEQKHNNTISEIFGSIDARKVKSCMTLFYLITNDVLFKDVIDIYYKGELCNSTITLLKLK